MRLIISFRIRSGSTWRRQVSALRCHHFGEGSVTAWTGCEMKEIFNEFSFSSTTNQQLKQEKITLLKKSRIYIKTFTHCVKFNFSQAFDSENNPNIINFKLDFLAFSIYSRIKKKSYQNYHHNLV